MLLLLNILPVLSLPLFWFINKRKVLHFINGVVSTLLLVIGVIISVNISRHGTMVERIPFNFFVDSLSNLILGIVLIIVFFTSLYCIGYLEAEFKHGKFDIKRIKLFYILLNIFIFTMLLTLTAGNIGIMWIAIEATTLASAFLVGFYNDKESLEAAWKYLIICSVGIALAMLGITFLHLSSVEIVKGTEWALYWPYLYAHPEMLKETTLRLAFIFVLLGFGTKAGLAPMHTWLPDAHSQAPAPVSALLSGVLLNSAMYGIMRILAIVNKSMGESLYTGRLLIAAGLLSILMAALFIMTQKDYKRLLAYSSIEHMGLISFGLGLFSSASIMASLLHMINHSFTKSMLFLVSGNVFLKFDTKKITYIKGLLRVLPISGTVFLLGIFAITGMPPFSIFASELALLIATFQNGHYVLGAMVVVLVSVIFVGFAVSLFKIFYGLPVQEYSSGEPNVIGAKVVSLLLIIILVSGLYMPPMIIEMIKNAQQILIGG